MTSRLTVTSLVYYSKDMQGSKSYWWVNKDIAARQAGQVKLRLLRNDVRQCSLWMFITGDKQTKPTWAIL